MPKTEFSTFVEIPIRVYATSYEGEKTTRDYQGYPPGIRIDVIADSDGNVLPKVIEDYILEKNQESLVEEARDKF